MGAAGAVLLGGAIAAQGFLTRATSASTPVHLGGRFALVDETGRAVTYKDFLGKPTAIYFGFTYCPEVCPTTLAAMTAWIRSLGSDADKFNFAFVTIDPDRDTPPKMKLYLSAFDPRIRGLTGTPAQVATIAREYRVYYQKVPLQGGGYSMDHSTGIYLLDAKGGFFGIIPYQEPAAQALAQMRDVLRSQRHD
jgi:protein SCO1/2